MSYYKILKQNTFREGDYSIVPIRMEDRYSIMKWRNEQIYHLRQNKPLTKEDQDRYFTEVVTHLFDHEHPNQILFSYLEDDTCIGYGGLVHINWHDRNAEISFIMDTSLENDEFEKHWSLYLKMIEEVAFIELQLHKIYTYAFDLRPNLYDILKKAGYNHEARLREHVFYQGQYIDVLINSKLFNVK